MKFLVVGSGGREHALARALIASPIVSEVIVAPGNGGTATTPGVRNAPVPDDDMVGLVDLALEEDVQLVVVGPEVPLALGLADCMTDAGVPCFGPSASAARLESSKRFAKEFMDRHNIPTARWAAFTEVDAALAWAEAAPFPLVVKASGLAAGKGVLVTDSADQAAAALRELMVGHAFGAAGDEVVVEERLEGPEVSVLAFCDGERLAVMPPAQDHKRVYEGDRGPNTGGMGAYAPAPVLDDDALAQVVTDVLVPTVRGMALEGSPFVGVLYAGLMLTAEGPRVLEFNARFGDPETEVILPLLKSDLANVLVACVQGQLNPGAVRWKRGAAATVVSAAPGYPGPYPKGLPIQGVEHAEALDGVVVYHAGTRRTDDGALVTNGGRVLAVTGVGDDLREALHRAYAGSDRVTFEGRHMRRDIGRRAL